MALLLGLLATVVAGAILLWRFDVSIPVSGGSSAPDRNRFQGVGDIDIPAGNLDTYWWRVTQVDEVSTVDSLPPEVAAALGDSGSGVYERTVLPVGITFQADSAELSEEARQALRVIVDDMQLDDAQVTVLCHSSSDGSPESRLKISEQRAEALADVMEEFLGRPAGSVSRRGLSDSYPISGVDPLSPSGRVLNRRCEILVEKQPSS